MDQEHLVDVSVRDAKSRPGGPDGLTDPPDTLQTDPPHHTVVIRPADRRLSPPSVHVK